MERLGTPAGLAEALAGLGLNGRQARALLPELAALSGRARRLALALARRAPGREAEALRAAAEALPAVDAEAAGLPLLALPPGAALAALRSLPQLAGVLGPAGLAEWLELARRVGAEELEALALRGPALLAPLGRRAGRLAVRLAGELGPELNSPAAGLALAASAAAARRRPLVVLAAALNLARERPGLARSFLEGLETGPAAGLEPAPLARWAARGLARERAGAAFFAPEARAGLVEADRLSGGLSLRRLLPWLAPYAAVHAGRRLGLELRGGDPARPWLDLEDSGSLSLPRRLGPETGRPRQVARALAALGAAARRLGLWELEPQAVREVLAGGGGKAPALQELPPLALFCAGFSAPPLAATLLALAVEARAGAELAGRFPGLARDLAALHGLRRSLEPPWPAMDPADRVAALAVLYAAGGRRPAQVLPADHQAATGILQDLAQAGGLRGLGLLELAGRMYGRLPPARQAPPQKQAGPAAAQAPGEGGREAWEEPGPATPLTGKPGPGTQGAPPPWQPEAAGEAEASLGAYTYPEWDPARGAASGRARVIERPAPEAGAGGLEELLARRAGAVRALERAFLALAPAEPAWRGGSREGPELDLAAVVTERAEAEAGLAPRGRVYRQWRPRRRLVSCGVLWDVSGSTRHNLEPERRSTRVVAAAREALAMFSRALAAAGDEFALWAFSGVGAARVDFYPLKRFDEPAGPQVLRRLCGLGPRAQNRDGAAIRHATRLLASRPARQRVLMVITDGRPDDYAYGPEVAGGDLPLALSGARARGVRPVAVLITPRGRTPHQAYRAVPHLILREVESLARWLPRLYRRLTV
jgi:hypothetical protein